MTLSGLNVPSLSEVTGASSAAAAKAPTPTPAKHEPLGEGLPLIGPVVGWVNEGVETDVKAAKDPLSALDPLKGWTQGVAALITDYGMRLLEILAGLGLIVFGLSTLANGGRTPSLSSATSAVPAAKAAKAAKAAQAAKAAPAS
jgi:hypothetical protein